MKIACPRCGADVTFDPTTQRCYCEYCGSSVDINEFELNQYKNEKDYSEIYDEFHCSSCGARLITDKTTTITRCVFCGSQQMIKQRMTGKFEPKEIVPFKINKEEFINKYTTFVNKKILAPEEFRKNPGVKETRGLYVPFHFFECNVSSYGRGLGQYHSDKTTYSKYFEYQTDDDLLIPIDGSTRLDDSIMASLEPYDLNGLVNFNPAYITGFQSECSDETEASLKTKAENRAFAHSINTINKKLGRYRHVSGYLISDAKGMNNDSKYVLLPVWFLNTNFKDKKYSYAINGQTGKVVGEIPLSKVKFYPIMAVLITLALIISLVLIVASAGSSRRSRSSDDDGPGGAIACVWIFGVATPYAAIKKRYKNITHVLETPVPFKNRKVIKDIEFKRKKDYSNAFPQDDLKGLRYQKYEDGKYIQDINMKQYTKEVKSVDKNQISVNNKDL